METVLETYVNIFPICPCGMIGLGDSASYFKIYKWGRGGT